MSTTVTVLIVYLGVLAALAIWSRRETHTLAGFYLADKKLPFWVVAFSTNATGESGWLLLGLSGMGYAVGAQAYWVVVGEIVGIALSWGLISRRLKRLGDATDSITVPDVLAAKFADRWHLIRGVAVLIIVVMVTTYVTAQMVSSGKAFSSFLGMKYETGVIVGAIFIIGYTFIGGYKAVSYTDVVQGVLMLLGLIAVPAAAIHAAGGWGEVKNALLSQDPALLDMFSFSSGPAWVGVASFLAVGLPFLGVPQLLIRYMSARDDGEIQKARIMSIIVLLFFTAGAVTAGVAGRALFPGLDDSETIFPVLSSELFPPVISGMLLVVVLSAIMSTVDSLLLLASSAVVRDTYQKIMGSTKSDSVLSNYGKLVTVIIGIIALVLGIQEPRVIFDFVLASWSGLGSAFGPAMIGILYYQRVTWAGVLSGMLGGFVVSVAWLTWFKADYHGLYEAIPGFLAGMILTFGVSWLTSHSKQGHS
ncbi:MAG: sodium/proline symporter [Gammaproteobacteria bacterium]|nr:sodium/proline symporter [Gammaproteobacteria bacterium]MBT8109295.1 sodium/proline symporter [Gammaproteobacteria bacterium]NND47768.1 sodium/proline symporter [Woeseiaceae bacterium]NNL43997.1 sodium/proline symporter [Woeseiaceae bacterium]